MFSQRCNESAWLQVMDERTTLQHSSRECIECRPIDRSESEEEGRGERLGGTELKECGGGRHEYQRNPRGSACTCDRKRSTECCNGYEWQLKREKVHGTAIVYDGGVISDILSSG